MTPAVVMRPILFPAASVNHNAPSGPATMHWGKLVPMGPMGLVVGIGYSVMAPPVVIRPILFPIASTNHSALSGPAVLPMGTLAAVGMGSSVMVWAVASPDPHNASAATATT